MAGSDVLSIGISGARSAQRALSTASHNIANANTEGFSRQRVEIVTRPAQFTGVGAIGNGADINSISRVHDAFISADMRNNATIAKGLEVYYDHTSQIDNTLADENAGLAPTLASFFAAINNISNDPSSQSARQVLLGEANSLSERFSYLDNRFETMKKSTNETLRSHMTDINNISAAIADINWKIVLSRELTQGEPNDLLDQRERLLHQLSEKVSVRTNMQDDGSINVFVGNGQTLVIGKQFSELHLQKNEHDPSKFEIVYDNNGVSSTVTKFMKGGVIGGLIDFREKVLAGAQNELGRIAIGISQTFNEQHRRGMTLENKLGENFFHSLDKTTPLTLARESNMGDYQLQTIITNVDNLTTSDYVLNYNDGLYTLVREDDDVVVDKFTSLPHHTGKEGFTISLKQGIEIKNGDSFLIRPTHAAARQFGVSITRTNDIAAASPIRIRKSVHNLGTITPSINEVSDIDAPSFKAEKKMLSPTITVRFIDANHIELLDDKGEVVKTQQLDDQGKVIPATPAIPNEEGEKGGAATPAVPPISADRSEPTRTEGEKDKNKEVAEEIDRLGKVIFYDPEKGINLFSDDGSMQTGYSIKLTGEAKAGDTFIVEYNKDAVGDNKNILSLGDLQNKKTLDNGTSNYSEVYSQLVSQVGSKTHELKVNLEAQNILYHQAIALQEEVSGVNLDEEGANLLRYQKAYEANATVIGAANEMFDTLINSLSR